MLAHLAFVEGDVGVLAFVVSKDGAHGWVKPYRDGTAAAQDCAWLGLVSAQGAERLQAFPIGPAPIGSAVELLRPKVLCTAGFTPYLYNQTEH